MKYFYIFTLLICSYFLGRVYYYISIVDCTKRTVSSDVLKKSEEFYRHNKLSRQHFVAFNYMKTYECIMGE